MAVSATDAPRHWRRNIGLLIVVQSVMQIIGIASVAIASLAAFELAENKALATLPVSLVMLVTATLLVPAGQFMQRYGRRAGLMLGAACGALSALGAFLALRAHSFELFVLAHLLAGGHGAAGSFTRFAAAEAAPHMARARVTAWVIAGGILAAFAVPLLVRVTTTAGSASYQYTYLAFAGFALVGVLAAWLLDLPPMPQPTPSHARRPFRAIVSQPVFITAVLCSATGFAVMAMIMTGTPLAMQLCGFSVGDSSQVIQWHMLGMFVPSLFVGEVLARIGLQRTMILGVALLAAQVVLGNSGIDYWHFTVGLVLLGVGWNFMFVGGTTLLAQAWRPGEEGRVQATHDLSVFALASIASVFSGSLIAWSGWNALNLAALPLLIAALIALLRYFRRRDVLAAP